MNSVQSDRRDPRGGATEAQSQIQTRKHVCVLAGAHDVTVASHCSRRMEEMMVFLKQGTCTV